MVDIAVGQELEFIAPVDVDGETIDKGTRARIGTVISELPEDRVFLVLLNAGVPRTIVVPRHIVTRYCRPVATA